MAGALSMSKKLQSAVRRVCPPQADKPCARELCEAYSTS